MCSICLEKPYFQHVFSNNMFVSAGFSFISFSTASKFYYDSYKVHVHELTFSVNFIMMRCGCSVYLLYFCKGSN